MTAQSSEPLPRRIPFSILTQTVRQLGWALAAALAVTLLVGAVDYPLERTSVDPSATSVGSDYVTVHGLPLFFVASDPSIVHRPALSDLAGHFVFDWFVVFAVFAVFVVLASGIRIIVFLAFGGGPFSSAPTSEVRDA